jgi:hypothetical protein
VLLICLDYFTSLFTSVWLLLRSTGENYPQLTISEASRSTIVRSMVIQSTLKYFCMERFCTASKMRLACLSEVLSPKISDWYLGLVSSVLPVVATLSVPWSVLKVIKIITMKSGTCDSMAAESVYMTASVETQTLCKAQTHLKLCQIFKLFFNTF